MLNIRFSTLYVVAIYVVVSYVIWTYKPLVFFTKSGAMKSFGLGDAQTVFYYPMILIFLSIIIFYIFELNN
jgi:hypothetical protein|uniref:Uncharacterized protein n=1 Tax=viral metagenome TaxID=1070528 RepID=A0A6C0B3U8_9ZZZZ